jgi:cell division protein FtsW
LNSLRKHIHGDIVIWMIVLFLSLVSLISVYSAAGNLAFRFKGGNAEYYLLNRAVMLAAGLLAMYAVHRVNYVRFSGLSVLGIVLIIPLLFVTLFLGSNVNDASRWLHIPGTGISFQTSDLAKLTLTLYLARGLARRRETIKDFKRGFLPLAIPLVLVCLLILPANFSTSALLFLTSTLLLFIGGVYWKHLLGLYGLAVLGFMLLIGLAFTAPKVLPRLETWKNRIENFFDKKPEDAYQVDQAKMSIAQGWPLGTGPGNNISKYRLPQSFSDFIFAFIIGEYGFFFGLGLLILIAYLALFYRIIRIAGKTDKAFATFACLGLGLSLILQAFVNMCVAVNILPVTGQPLPWVSMGGTSTIFTGITLGIILSISRTTEPEKEDVAEEGLNQNG